MNSLEPRELRQRRVGQCLRHEALQVRPEVEAVRQECPPAHLLKLSVAVRGNVGAVVDEFQTGRRDQEVVGVDVAAHYPDVATLAEQGKQPVETAARVWGSCLVWIDGNDVVAAHVYLPYVEQRPAPGELAYEGAEEGDLLLPVPGLPVVEVLVGHAAGGQDHAFFADAEAGERACAELGPYIRLGGVLEGVLRQRCVRAMAGHDVGQAPEILLDWEDIGLGDALPEVVRGASGYRWTPGTGRICAGWRRIHRVGASRATMAMGRR